jgi:hypothetical protein
MKDWGSFFFAVLWFELRTVTLSHLPAFFSKGFFEVGSHKVFAWAGFEM